jgi:nucleotide-binding universal stress UspA family protein
MNEMPHELVVGIGDEGSPAAVRFAVEEARRSGRPVHLVHVLQLPGGDAFADVYGGVYEQATDRLTEAQAYAVQLAGDDVVVTSELVDHGWAVDELVHRATGEQMLVLEHRALGRLHRVLSGSVVQGVAARAQVPVVSVPEGWTPPAAGDAVVTAAVQDATEAPALLRAAFGQARETGARLVVLHAWWLASGFNASVVDETMRADFARRGRAELEPVLAPLRSAFSDVEVSVDVRHAPAVEAVLDAAEVSRLVVLGRRHHLLPLGTHLGPVARAALGHATTPVLITPEVEVTAKEARAARRARDLIDNLAPIS